MCCQLPGAKLLDPNGEAYSAPRPQLDASPRHYSPLPKTGAHPEKYGRVLYKLLSETGASLDDIFLCKIMFLV